MMDKETIKQFFKPNWKKILVFAILLFILYFYGYAMMSFFYPPKSSLEKQVCDEGNKVLYIPSTASVNCQKIITDNPLGTTEYYIQVFTKLKRLHVTYKCDVSWVQKGVTYSITANSGFDLDSSKLIKNSIKMKISNTSLRINFDGTYITKSCDLPSLKKIDDFLTENTRLDVNKADKIVEIPHIDLRDSEGNIVSVYWDTFYDFNVDGIIDMDFDFNPGYARDSVIRLMYSRTPNRDKIKYVTIHSGKEIGYVINGLSVRINSTGDINMGNVPSYLEGYNRGDCERYFLLDITTRYGIPCDTDWVCRVNYVSHRGICIKGLCVYPIVCKYRDAVDPNDFSEESYCKGPCKYNKSIKCNFFRISPEINKSHLLDYYDFGLLTGE